MYTRNEYCQEDIVVKCFDSDFPVKDIYILQFMIVASESDPFKTHVGSPLPATSVQDLP